MASVVPEYLFVYGTLRQGHRTSASALLMHRLKFLSEGSTPGSLIDLGEYPGAVFDDQSTEIVSGEIYLLPTDPEVLERLDEYEEFNPRNLKQSLFLRKIVRVQTNDQRTMECWTYELNRVQRNAQIKNSP